jgi:N-acetylmuramoyl-L-alanine amidase
VRLFVDPGHGGADVGAVGPRGTAESGIAWSYAGIVVQEARRRGWDVTMSRERTEDPGQITRANRANRWGADVVVSCHCNGFRLPSAHGAEVLYWDGSARGEALARRILSEIIGRTGLVNRGVKPRRSGSRGAALLRTTAAPCVIVEPAFITNPDEEELLLQPETQHAIAEAIVFGVLPVGA